MGILPDITKKLFVFGVVRNLGRIFFILKHQSSLVNYVKIMINRVHVIIIIFFCDR